MLQYLPPQRGRSALEGKGPQRRPQKRLGRRLEEVAKAVGGGYCRLQMPLSRHLPSGGQRPGGGGGGRGSWRPGTRGVAPPPPGGPSAESESVLLDFGVGRRWERSGHRRRQSRPVCSAPGPLCLPPFRSCGVWVSRQGSAGGGGGAGIAAQRVCSTNALRRGPGQRAAVGVCPTEALQWAHAPSVR